MFKNVLFIHGSCPSMPWKHCLSWIKNKCSWNASRLSAGESLSPCQVIMSLCHEIIRQPVQIVTSLDHWSVLVPGKPFHHFHGIGLIYATETIPLAHENFPPDVCDVYFWPSIISLVCEKFPSLLWSLSISATVTIFLWLFSVTTSSSHPTSRNYFPTSWAPLRSRMLAEDKWLGLNYGRRVGVSID